MLNDKELAEFWRLFPHTFAQKLSVGKWKPFNYLKFISEEIARAISQGNGRILVSLPPRAGKSELISFWVPIWYLSLYPEKNVILSSYGDEFAATWGRRVRNEIEANPLIGLKLSEDSSAANRWNTNLGGGMVTAGIGSSLTGRGFDLGLLDDPIKNWEEATSEVYRRRAIDWFQSTFLTRAEPKATTILLMTRWHSDDLAGWIEREHGDKWKIIKFPALAESNDPLGREEGSPLCPERFSIEELQEIKKAVGSRVWASLYQQRPSPAEGGFIKRHWLKYYDRLPDGCTDFLQSWDLSFGSTKESGSWVVGQVWARKGANRYLVDQFRDKVDFTETIQAIKSLLSKWPQSKTILIEKKANGAAVIETLKGIISGIIAIEPKGSKENRLMAVSPTIESGNVFIPMPEKASWVSDFIEELVSFPSSLNSDQCDCVSQALSRFEAKKVVPLHFVMPDLPKASLWNN